MAPSFVPGPVDVDIDVLNAQTKQMLPHRSAEYEEIFHRAENNARKLFGTQNRVLINASSGSGLHEAAVRNFANQSVLCCVNGAFGKRFFDVATANGKRADQAEAEWGQPIDPEAVAEMLAQKPYEVLTMVHNETSTGLQNPVAEIAAAARNVSPETIICVDAVSSLAGAPIEMDDWDLDFVLASSQKALALPPGLALGATSDRALQRAEIVPNRGWYFDLVKLENYRLRNSTPATSAVSLVYALDKQMARILAEGLDARYARHKSLRDRVIEWALANGFGPFAAEGHRSRTVTTIENIPGIDVPALNESLMARDMRIANGYGTLKNKTFRIAHMGEVRMEDLETLLAAIEEFMGQS